MTQRVHYSKAPIIEALIDLRIKHLPNLSVEQLSAISADVEKDFPKRENLYHGEINLEVKDNQTAQAEGVSSHIGFRFSSSDGQWGFQTRLDGFTFTHYPQYTNWENFHTKAFDLWKIYCSVAKPESVVRSALRYINRLDFPAIGVVKSEDYLRTYPEVSPDIPHSSLLGHFMQLQMPQPDLDCMLVLNQARVPSPHPDVVSIMLDIDLFAERPNAPWSSDDITIWEFLEQLRNRKNEIFEASITDKTRELIR